VISKKRETNGKQKISATHTLSTAGYKGSWTNEAAKHFSNRGQLNKSSPKSIYVYIYMTFTKGGDIEKHSR